MFVIKYQDFINLENQEDFVNEKLTEALAEMKEDGREWEEGEALFWSYDFSIDTFDNQEITNTVLEALEDAEEEKIAQIKAMLSQENWLTKIFDVLNLDAHLFYDCLYYQAVLGEDYNFTIGSEETTKADLIKEIVNPYFEDNWILVYDGRYPSPDSVFNFTERLKSEIEEKIESLQEE